MRELWKRSLRIKAANKAVKKALRYPSAFHSLSTPWPLSSYLEVPLISGNFYLKAYENGTKKLKVLSSIWKYYFKRIWNFIKKFFFLLSN